MFKEVEEAMACLERASVILQSVSEKISKIENEATVDKIIDVVCSVFDVEKKFVINDFRNRMQTYVYPRSVCILQIKKRFPSMSVSSVCRVFKVSRASYYNGIKVVNNTPLLDSEMRKIKTVDLILDEIFG